MSVASSTHNEKLIRLNVLHTVLETYEGEDLNDFLVASITNLYFVIK